MHFNSNERVQQILGRQRVETVQGDFPLLSAISLVHFNCETLHKQDRRTDPTVFCLSSSRRDVLGVLSPFSRKATFSPFCIYCSSGIQTAARQCYFPRFLKSASFFVFFYRTPLLSQADYCRKPLHNSVKLQFINTFIFLCMQEIYILPFPKLLHSRQLTI